ncbi:MAG: marine proteobacterial sortase target protein [Phycisphaerales bacterium]|nr:marine proteobacterial sortase target protein [Phycisphaerales bacterium]
MGPSENTNLVRRTPNAEAQVTSDVPVPGGLWRTPFVQNILPFLTSLSLHAMVLVVGLLTLTAIKALHQEPMQDQPFVADTVLDASQTMGFQGSVDLPMVKPMQDQVPDVSLKGWNLTAGPALNAGLAGGGSGSDSDPVIGVGSGGFGTKSGLGTGSGDRRGSGSGEGGPMAVFGPNRIGGSEMFRPPSGARKIAFVCDASGSMLTKMASLKLELSKAVNALKPNQSFGVTFFHETRCTSLDSSLVAATPQNKRKANNFLEDVTSAGPTDPIPGIEQAFRQQPELIFLLTDGDFPDNALVLRRIRELNRDKRVKINTIAFVNSSDSDTAFLGLLKTIATENGGAFKRVAEDELER